MLAFPSETKNESDRCVCSTVERLVSEEIGVTLDTDFELIAEPLTHFSHGLPVYVAVAIVSNEFEAKPNDDDVAYCGWLKGDAILEMSKVAGCLRIKTLGVHRKWDCPAL